MTLGCRADDAALIRPTTTLYPHPEERPLGRVSKDGRQLGGPAISWFETALRASSP